MLLKEVQVDVGLPPISRWIVANQLFSHTIIIPALQTFKRM
jgi:hypothetical protein